MLIHERCEALEQVSEIWHLHDHSAVIREQFTTAAQEIARIVASFHDDTEWIVGRLRDLSEAVAWISQLKTVAAMTLALGCASAPGGRERGRITVEDLLVNVNGSLIDLTGVENLSVDGVGGDDTIVLTGTTVTGDVALLGGDGEDAVTLNYPIVTGSLTTDGGAGVSNTLTVNLTDVSPTITAGQTLSVSELATNGTGVGSVATTGDAPTTFTITAGNTGAAFAIDNAGNITVNDTAQPDFDTAIEVVAAATFLPLSRGDF